MKHSSSLHRHNPELFWPKTVFRKWLNIRAKVSDYSAHDKEDGNSDSDPEEINGCDPRDETGDDPTDALPRIRRRKSETFRAQYISTKEIKVCVGTWNVGGKLPPDDIDIESWLDVNSPADIYVIGLQEIIPLNAGNIFGAEDNRPVLKWENIIRETLNRVQPSKPKFKCYSDPTSPSRFIPSDDAPIIEDEIMLESDSDNEEEFHPLNELSSNDFQNAESLTSSDSASSSMSVPQELERQFSSPKRLDRQNFLKTDDSTENTEPSFSPYDRKLTKTLSRIETIALSWPEPPLDLLAKHVLDRPKSLEPTISSKSSKPFVKYNSFSFSKSGDNRVQSEADILAKLDLESLMYRKRRPQFVRIVSKQMVGIFITVWVRRSLRRHIQNLKVSTVGVGVMGYIGNKGSVSVSMSIHQTLFCFICTHLTSGEKEAEAIKRNADVHEIYRRTRFHSLSGFGLPKGIRDHERIIWLGDLNYRIDLSYDKTRELISRKDWSKLLESDQLTRELRKGRAFGGWREGILNFPPTYKYESNSEKYCGEDPKVGRRTPSWCDRILSFGKGMKLSSYGRSELSLSDHRPVTACYKIEVEEFSPRKLQRALTFTNAEIVNPNLYQPTLLGTWRSTSFGIYGYLHFTKAGYVDHSKTFNPADMDTRIDGKNCVVTGANSGIGFATAQGLASRGANVYMVCRNKERGEDARSIIQSTTNNQNVYLEVCDLSSVSDIKAFTSRFSSKDVPIHVLVNNAGLLENNRVLTSEGYELNFAVNVLGTYTMTESMLPLLEKTAPDARVITVSSGGMYTSPLTEDLQYSSSKFDGVDQYARNKRVQVALTEKWADKYKNKGVGFYSMHPGWAETPGVSKSLPSFSKSFEGKLRTSEEGADTVLWLALQPKEKLVSGSFYFDRTEASKHIVLAATKGSHSAIDSIVTKLHSLSSLSS